MDVIGDIPLANPPTSEPEVKDALDLARSEWRKGRHEAMGGPVTFVQDGRNNSNRTCSYPPAARFQDPVAESLGVDSQE